MKQEDASNSVSSNHNRRISRLDDVAKFEASLESVKVVSRSGSLIENTQPIKEEDEEEAK